ncbi:MAG: hypothetical protein JXB49_36560 [Bacteroidales bacterium]|nr:hypothetical protein [Bacteroidales bacterium]
MKNNISIVMLILGIIGTLGGGFWAYYVKYHTAVVFIAPRDRAMIPGLVICVIGIIVLIIGIRKYRKSDCNEDSNK